MTVISTQEFNTQQEKYFEYPEQIILEPDDNLRKAITAEELLERIHGDIHRKFASRV
ncbi:MAG: hypothetical protein FWG84_06305 [Bacteroidales bacterium]|nr:hypothetical protein [Bacteroidales bacterium]